MTMVPKPSMNDDEDVSPIKNPVIFQLVTVVYWRVRNTLYIKVPWRLKKFKFMTPKIHDHENPWIANKMEKDESPQQNTTQIIYIYYIYINLAKL